MAPEFTSVCPKTGQPDFGTIEIEYVPRRRCVELKSLKLYLQGFRNQGIFYEDVINRILDDLVAALAPRRMTVRGRFNTRGGMHSVVEATHTDGAHARTAGRNADELPRKGRRRTVRYVALALAAGLLLVGAWQLFFAKRPLAVVSAEFKSIYGQPARVTAVVEGGYEAEGDAAVQAASQEMLRIEALMSSDREDSDIARFNIAPAGENVKMSPATLEVLHLAKDYCKATDGAFDVTCRPLLKLWRKAADDKRQPSDEEIAAARAKVGWDKVEPVGGWCSQEGGQRRV